MRGLLRPSLHRSISIHALREEGDGKPGHVQLVGFISIHALREEGDTGPRCRPAPACPGLLISIHALREEGDTAS